SAQIREILISESAWEEMTCLFAPSLANKMERISCPINTGTHKGNRQITSTNQLLNKRSVEYIQLLEYHAVPLLVLYALFFTMIYR
ncbi:hypothetical protein ACJWR8_25740, partial [Klebsiella pneumoniae]